MTYSRTRAGALLCAAASLALLGACSDEPDTDVYAPANTEVTETDPETDVAMGDERPENLSTPAEIDAHENEGIYDRRVVVGYEIRDRDDVPVFVESAFERADRDGDGTLDYEEYLLIAPTLGQADATIGQGQATTPGPTDYENPNPAADTVEQQEFYRTVAGDDGMTPEELESALMERFDMADADGDGELSPDETRDFLRLGMAEMESPDAAGQ